jgi:hypothetical protein
MEFDEYEVFLRGLMNLLSKFDERFDVQEEFNRQQVSVNGRLADAIERLDLALAFFKDLLDHGNDD